MEYTPPEETNRRLRQREIEAEREREQKVQQRSPCKQHHILLGNECPAHYSVACHR